MKNLSKKIQELLNGIQLRKQLSIIYSIGFFIPMACIGMFLIFNTARLLTNYHVDLNKANNMRVKTIMFEITTQVYNISQNLVINEGLQYLLSEDFSNKEEFLDSAAKYEDINNYLDFYTEIEDITVYCDNPTIQHYAHIEVTKEVSKSDWYQKAVNQVSAFWTTIKQKDRYGNTYYNLCLVRQIQLTNENRKAVLVIKIDENYLKNQLNSSDFKLLLYSDIGGVFFSSDREWYDISDMIYINYRERYYNYSGQIFVEDKKYITTVTTCELCNTDNSLYICNMSNAAYDNINQILSVCLLIVVTATVIPFLLFRYFIANFSGRVDTLRKAMHKVSNDNYDVPAQLMGEDEISQAFADLQKMVAKIKDKDARMYEARINTQRLQNAQQRIEMNVLASQINPHFLYNTLETIRMKAFKVGDRDVATAIKLLGKSMRYVLENTGTSSTTLYDELEYIETYLQIQKLRFVGRINYSIVIEEGLNTEEIDILPLLIQPIVENAIVHGLEDTEENGLIRIEVHSSKKELLQIQIADNGCGMNKEELMALRTKLDTPHQNPNRNIGLYNINQRIRLCYGGTQYGIVLNSQVGMGTSVILMLPLKINREAI